MPRLIEIDDPASCARGLTLEAGDVLLVAASGGQVRIGDGVMDAPGAMTRAVVGDNGEVFTPMGPPSVVMFIARAAGRARIEVMTGDPFHAPRKTEIDVVVV